MSYAKKLGRFASLTEAQLESLSLYRRVLNGEITSKEAARLRTPKPVSLGTYHRVLNQAVRNLQASVWTVLAAVNLGLLREQELKRLIDLLPKTSGLQEGSEIELLAVIQAIVSHIVMK